MIHFPVYECEEPCRLSVLRTASFEQPYTPKTSRCQELRTSFLDRSACCLQHIGLLSAVLKRSSEIKAFFPRWYRHQSLYELLTCHSGNPFLAFQVQVLRGLFPGDSPAEIGAFVTMIVSRTIERPPFIERLQPTLFRRATRQ